MSICATLQTKLTLFGCPQVLLNPNTDLRGVLELICCEANKLTHQGIYYARQLYFKTGRWIDKQSLSYEDKTSKHFQALYSQAAQQTLIAVYELFQSCRPPHEAGRQHAPHGAVNKAARWVINPCIQNRLGRLSLAGISNNKDSSTLGKKTHPEFVQIPPARLKERMAQLCEQYGIDFVETEESYTWQAAFVEGDFLPTFSEKPDSWKSSGKRIQRGLFRTA